MTTPTLYQTELLDTLYDVITQACLLPAGSYDSMALSAYADGIRVLAKAGRLVIVKDDGRRVIAERVTPTRNQCNFTAKTD